MWNINAIAQSKNFDVVSYHQPVGWKQTDDNSYVAYSKTDGTQWAQMAIYKSTASKGDIESDLDKEWEAIVLALNAEASEENTKIDTVNGWMVKSRSGVWKYQDANVTSILTVFSNDKICISLLCNTNAERYFEDFKHFVSSIKFNSTQSDVTKIPTTDMQKKGIIGLWGSYDTEASGVVNGTRMLTGGYFRKEYLFKADGTYQYTAKDWSVTVKQIRIVYETGKYVLNGNQLTLTPTQGKGEWWNKASNGSTEGWGTRVKAFQHPLEKLSYTIEMKYLSGMEANYLYLKHPKRTARDGSQSNQNTLHEFSYVQREANKTLIDFPSGFTKK